MEAVTYSTRAEINGRINALKQWLRDTDYKALKAYEGHPGTTWEQDEINREAWREEVDALQTQLESLPVDDLA